MAKTVAKSAVAGALHEGAHSEFQGPGPGDGSGFSSEPSASFWPDEKKYNEPEKEKK